MEEPINGKQAAEIMHAVDCLDRETHYVESIQMTAVQVAGTRYKIIISGVPQKER